MTNQNDKINQCKSCGTMKHTAADGLCGRCRTNENSELDTLLQDASCNIDQIIVQHIFKKLEPKSKKKADELWAITCEAARLARVEVREILGSKIQSTHIRRDEVVAAIGSDIGFSGYGDPAVYRAENQLRQEIRQKFGLSQDGERKL